MQSSPYNGFGTALTGYSQLKITIGQLAQLLSNGGYEDVSGSGQVTSDNGSWGSQLGQGLLALNPQLSSGYESACAGCVIVGAGSGIEWPQHRGPMPPPTSPPASSTRWCPRSWPALPILKLRSGLNGSAPSRTSARRLPRTTL